ncbi:hypothetical protein [Saccharicrinis fermentans]|uniref:Uncharacterized protein n=1 Tax=Saccharicrinis fermentans DSM 9555 = JCM 21142 TaxID=869213 RepID=W7YSP3_9BACT|nr:hypothetical protein [Saccharicrinis fermentans]GAF05484.1 hypothetical protein JCM21142_104219 [Saccharicrinis fermentans DSM 9555 = JCM 21142]
MAGLALFIGGSKALGADTKTSDVDYFIIKTSSLEDELQFIVSQLTKEADIEERSLDWLVSFYEKVKDFKIRIDGKHPAIDYWDLRFISRVLIGKQLVFCEQIDSILENITGYITAIQNQFVSANFLNKYEDLLGLCLDNRFEEFYLEISELLKFALQVSLVKRNQIIELNSKWILFQIKQEHNLELNQLINEFYKHFYSRKFEKMSLLYLMRIVKTIALASSQKEDELTAKVISKPEICPLGIKGYKVAMNIFTKDIMIL